MAVWRWADRALRERVEQENRRAGEQTEKRCPPPPPTARPIRKKKWISVGRRRAEVPRVVASRQPWAVSRNAFGVGDADERGWTQIGKKKQNAWSAHRPRCAREEKGEQEIIGERPDGEVETGFDWAGAGFMNGHFLSLSIEN